LSVLGVISSVQVRDPGSLRTPAPMCFFASHRLKIAPVGSWMTAMRPMSLTSNGSINSVPPSSLALAAERSALSTDT
jgi:hypothetical protein